jgi:triacylglycerol lipase
MEYVLVKKWLFLCLFSVLFLNSPAAGADQSTPCRIVFVPGAFGASTSGLFLRGDAYFSEYEAYFRAKGCQTRRVEFPLDVTIEVRARILRDVVQSFGSNSGENTAIVLIAHSQGGLDSRFALKTLGLKGVSQLFSIGVPHRGALLARWVRDQRDRKTFIYWVLRLFGSYDLKHLSFLNEMTPDFLQTHEDHFLAVPDVKYASARSRCQRDCHWALRLLDHLSGLGGVGAGEPGDGLIEVSSQSFGGDLGEYDLDHISEVNDDVSKRPERLKLMEKIASRIF